MKDLGQLHHFLGATDEPRPSGLLLYQRLYALDILERAGMTDCKPAPLLSTLRRSCLLIWVIRWLILLPTGVCQRFVVPHLHQAGPHLHCSAGLSPYA